ncbi:MAG TPA: cytochrome c1 [Alphaproteobacteria bacterium]|nr:cytochrome c1 [Alphaproteobacteria bacterium]
MEIRAMRVSAFFLFALLLASPAFAESGEPMHPHSPPGGWPEKGVFGSYDRAALQRGLLVYKQVCAACHSLNLVAYRDLAALGYSEAEIKAIAAEKTVADAPDDQGKIGERPARPSDHFVPPFANDQAARFANNGALPPDLSLIIKARHGGEDYVYSLLTGFGHQPPADLKIMPGMNYNPYFPGGQIAMPPPLSDNAVAYGDGTAATTDQMAKDVVQFLAWAAEPHMEQRKRVGIRVMLFLLAMAGIFFAAKKRIWRDVH